jgi:hypothetical protein
MLCWLRSKEASILPPVRPGVGGARAATLRDVLRRLPLPRYGVPPRRNQYGQQQETAMHRPTLPSLRFHPRPLTILAAIVLCLCVTAAFSQTRTLQRATPRAPAATGGLPAGTPSQSGLTSGAAPGLATPGAPSATGLTSGSSPALTTNLPAQSGLTSGTAGGLGTGTTPGTGAIGGGVIGVTPDRTATAVGGSTRGVVVLPSDSSGVNTGVTGTVGNAATGTTGVTGTVGSAATGATANAGAAVVSQAGGGLSGGLGNGVPSVSPNGVVSAGPLTALSMTQMFGQADSNGDGLLSRAEALRLPMVTMTFEDMDRNRDGWVSSSEYQDSLR